MKINVMKNLLLILLLMNLFNKTQNLDMPFLLEVEMAGIITLENQTT